MLRRKCSILILFGMSFFPITQVKAQVPVGTVVNIASKYLTLLQSHQNDVVYEHTNIEERIDEHNKIAIIPFVSHISYAKPIVPNKDEAQEQFESQQMVGRLLQEQFWDVFDNHKSDIFLQDIRITNKVLDDIGYFLHPDDFPPTYLAELLQVDAVIICTYDIHVDNSRTGWQNLTKALGEVAMTSLKSYVPGMQALHFIKDPNLIINLVTKPGQFFTKLKNGDISDVLQIAGGLVPEGPWKKVAEIAAKNSNTITKIAKGDTKNLISDLVKDNAGLLGTELKLDPQVVSLLKNNSTTIQNVMQGNTKGLMFDLINNNVSTLAQQYIGNQNQLLTNAISNNTSVFAKLATGDTKDLMQEFISKNIKSAAQFIPGENASFYSNLLIDNKDVVSKIVKGDIDGITTQLLMNNTSLVGELIPEGDAKKYLSLLADKEKITGILEGDTQTILATITEQGAELFGDKIEGLDLEKTANFLGNNKEVINNILSGDTSKIITSFAQIDTKIFGENADIEQIQNVINLISKNGDSIEQMLSGSATALFSSWLSDIGVQVDNNVIDNILKNKNAIQSIFKGNRAQLVKDLGGKVDAKTIDIILENKSKFNELVGLNEDEDFTILNKNADDIKVMAYQFMDNKETLSGIMQGNADGIYNSLSTNENNAKNYVIDKKFAQLLSTNLVNEQKNISTVMANSKINQMLLTDQIDLQFFEFSNDALLEDYETVGLRKKTVSQTTASILDPTLDPKDSTRLSINIFDKTNNEVLWQYINENSKARLYDMKSSVEKVVKRINKRFPYFTKYK